MEKITAAQIKEWKKRHGDVFQIDVTLDDEGNQASAFFKKPDLKIVGLAAKFAEVDPVKSGNIMFESCWLGGNEIVKTNDEAKLSAIKELGTLFKVRQAQIKKL